MNTRLVKVSGWFMVLFSLFIAGSWTGLIATFDYPDVLRYDVGVVLQKYNDGGAVLRLYWVGMSLSGFVLLALSVMLYRILGQKKNTLLLVGTVFGVAAGLFNALGFIRWVFVTKLLADLYTSPNVSAATKDAVAVNFQVLNSYFGVSVGETLGYISMSIWIIILCITLLQTSLTHRIIPILGIASGVGTFIGIFEWIGFEAAAQINAYSVQLWLVLLIVIGFHFIIKSNNHFTVRFS